VRVRTGDGKDDDDRVDDDDEKTKEANVVVFSSIFTCCSFIFSVVRLTFVGLV
jgi:hypothetical protein